MSKCVNTAESSAPVPSRPRSTRITEAPGARAGRGERPGGEEASGGVSVPPLSPRRPRDSTLERVFLQDLHEEEDAQKWILSVSLFEALVERLEREEARVRDTQVLVDVILRADGEDLKSASAPRKGIQREGNVTINHQAGLTREYSGETPDPSERRSGRRPTILDNFTVTGQVEDRDEDDNHATGIATVERSRAAVRLAKKVGLPVMRDLVEATVDRMDPVDPEKRNAAAEHARAVVAARRKGEAEAVQKSRKRKAKKGRKARKAGYESEEEEEEDIAGVPNDFLSAAFDYWASRREQHQAPLPRCSPSFLVRRWRRMSDPVREAQHQAEVVGANSSEKDFKVLDSHLEDLQKARRISDDVDRREALRRTALRFAEDYWTIVDQTMGGGRGRAPASGKSSAPKPVDPPVPTRPLPCCRSIRLVDGARRSTTGNGRDTCATSRLSEREEAHPQESPALAFCMRPSTLLAAGGSRPSACPYVRFPNPDVVDVRAAARSSVLPPTSASVGLPTAAPSQSSLSQEAEGQETRTMPSATHPSTRLAANFDLPPKINNFPDDAIARGGGRVQCSTCRAAAETRERVAALFKTKASSVLPPTSASVGLPTAAPSQSSLSQEAEGQETPTMPSATRPSTRLAANFDLPPKINNFPDDAIARGGGRVRCSTRRAAAETRKRLAALFKGKAAEAERNYDEAVLTQTGGDDDLPRNHEEGDGGEQEDDDMNIDVDPGPDPPPFFDFADSWDDGSPSDMVVEWPPVVVSDASEQEGEGPPPPPVMSGVRWPGQEAVAEATGDEEEEMPRPPPVFAGSKRKGQGASEEEVRPSKMLREEPTPRESGMSAAARSAAAAEAEAAAVTAEVYAAALVDAAALAEAVERTEEAAAAAAARRAAAAAEEEAIAAAFAEAEAAAAADEERARHRGPFDAAQGTREDGAQRRQRPSSRRRGAGRGGRGQRSTLLLLR